MIAVDMDAIPFVKARNFTATGRTGRQISLIVIHDMEYPEKLDAAEQVAKYFAGTNAPQASAHYCIDADSIIQCVRDKDVAWHAPGANSNGIGLEHAGYAAQRREDWADAYSTAELQLSAALARQLCQRYGIPMEYVSEAGLTAGSKGITTHAAVSRAFRKSTHTDPGAGFPMDLYLAMVRDADPHPAEAPTVPTANAPFATILVHPPTGGYLEVGEDGGVWAWGGAPFFGSLGGVKLNAPIVDAAWTADHGGYYLIARDGGIFAFGNARHQGNALWAG